MTEDKNSQNRVYSDSGEAELLAFFSEKPESQLFKEKMELLGGFPNWGTRIHLSPRRHNLLDWYFLGDKKGSMLEVGAGVGPLTGLFLDHCERVTAVEPSPVRSEIIRKRFADKTNLTVSTKDIAQFESAELFDFVSLIGVLEYAGVFFNGGSKNYDDSVFISFLSTCRKQLKETGTLILAIENQWGLKYLSGCVEDHYQTLFPSLNDYPNYTGVRTFGKTHLTTLLQQAGFTGSLEWYFPFPDYKLPQQVVSESFLNDFSFPLSWLYPSPEGITQRLSIFNELAAAHSLKQNKLLSEVANSFLVFARAS